MNLGDLPWAWRTRHDTWNAVQDMWDTRRRAILYVVSVSAVLCVVLDPPCPSHHRNLVFACVTVIRSRFVQLTPPLGLSSDPCPTEAPSSLAPRAAADVTVQLLVASSPGSAEVTLVEV